MDVFDIRVGKKMCVMLFKMWKEKLELTNQTPPKHGLNIENGIVKLTQSKPFI